MTGTVYGGQVKSVGIPAEKHGLIGGIEMSNFWGSVQIRGDSAGGDQLFELVGYMPPAKAETDYDLQLVTQVSMTQGGCTSRCIGAVKRDNTRRPNAAAKLEKKQQKSLVNQRSTRQVRL